MDQRTTYMSLKPITGDGTIPATAQGPPVVFGTVEPDGAWIELGAGYIIQTVEEPQAAQVKIDDTNENFVVPLHEPPETFVVTRNLDERWRKLEVDLVQPEKVKKLLETPEDFIHKCHYCVSRFSSLEPLRIHLQRHAKIECAICKERFHNEQMRDWHLRRMHKEGSDHDTALGIHYFCKCCALGFAEENDTLEHLQKCHQEYIKQETIKMLENRQSSSNNDSKYTCTKCQVVVTGAGHIAAHNLFHQDPTIDKYLRDPHVYKCSQCDKTFNRPSHYNLHIQEHALQSPKNADGYANCLFCNRSLKTDEGLKMHMRLKHFEEDPFDCKFCELSYTTFRSLNKHQIEEHGIQQIFQCDMCRISFPSYYLNRKHNFEVHTYDVEHKLDLIGK